MTLPSGTTLGSYEVLTPIGAGGMGEVYRARDTKLGRDVAVKVLPDAFARDAERMARFQREAKLLASLNHSNIASIYGIEDANGTRALVMELADGPTLAERVAQGPIALEDALPIAKQIADALEYAHEHGIIHRDLKPANVKVAGDDTVKILDFGLAKALESNSSAADIANSPTLSQMATQAGMLLGTAAYMSPEQAKGKPVDRRADIWAFGCVLYEILTGKKAFRGETVTDTLAAIMRAEPDWLLLPKATPMRVRVLLQRCLQKDPKQRLRDIGDARISLDEVLSGAPDRLSSSGESLEDSRGLSALVVQHPFVFASCALLLGALIAGLGLWFFRRPPSAPAQVIRFQIPIPEGTLPSAPGPLSPDGKQLAFLLIDSTSQRSRVWIRALDSLQARPLDGTEGATSVFWSPDSKYIAFSTANRLVKIQAAGGPAQTLCDISPSASGGSWSRDGQILFGSDSGIMRVPAAGGSPVAVTRASATALPYFLPDGRHFVYLIPPGNGDTTPGLYVSTIDGDPTQPPLKKLLSDISPAVYVPAQNSSEGYLLFVRGEIAAPGAVGTLVAQPFDPRRLTFTSDAIPIADGVPNTGFSVSPGGTIVYLTSEQQVSGPGGVRGVIQGRLAWLDRAGKVLGTFGDPGVFRTLAVSPDGKRLAFERFDAQNSSVRNIWLFEFARGVTTRFTFGSVWDSTPLWSPDGSSITYGSERQTSAPFDLYRKPSNLAGEAELLLSSRQSKVPSSWSPDGKVLVFFNPVPPVRLWALPVGPGMVRQPVQIGDNVFNQAIGRISPNGRWITYSSDESGRPEIFVRPFDEVAALGSPADPAAPTGKWMISKDGGNSAMWGHDGKELFYISLSGMAMTVNVSTNGIFQAGVPKPMFKVPSGVLFWDVSPDAKRFVMAIPSAESTAPKFNVVLNWQSALKK